MGLNRLLKKLAPGETLEEALYKKLTERKLPGGSVQDGRTGRRNGCCLSGHQLLVEATLHPGPQRKDCL